MPLLARDFRETTAAVPEEARLSTQLLITPPIAGCLLKGKWVPFRTKGFYCTHVLTVIVSPLNCSNSSMWETTLPNLETTFGASFFRATRVRRV